MDKIRDSTIRGSSRVRKASVSRSKILTTNDNTRNSTQMKGMSLIFRTEKTDNYKSHHHIDTIEQKILKGEP